MKLNMIHIIICFRKIWKFKSISFSKLMHFKRIPRDLSQNISFRKKAILRRIIGTINIGGNYDIWQSFTLFKLYHKSKNVRQNFKHLRRAKENVRLKLIDFNFEKKPPPLFVPILLLIIKIWLILHTFLKQKIFLFSNYREFFITNVWLY